VCGLRLHRRWGNGSLPEEVVTEDFGRLLLEEDELLPEVRRHPGCVDRRQPHGHGVHVDAENVANLTVLRNRLHDAGGRPRRPVQPLPLPLFVDLEHPAHATDDHPHLVVGLSGLEHRPMEWDELRTQDRRVIGLRLSHRVALLIEAKGVGPQRQGE